MATTIVERASDAMYWALRFSQHCRIVHVSQLPFKVVGYHGYAVLCDSLGAALSIAAPCHDCPSEDAPLKIPLHHYFQEFETPYGVLYLPITQEAEAALQALAQPIP